MGCKQRIAYNPERGDGREMAAALAASIIDRALLRFYLLVCDTSLLSWPVIIMCFSPQKGPQGAFLCPPANFFRVFEKLTPKKSNHTHLTLQNCFPVSPKDFGRQAATVTQ